MLDSLLPLLAMSTAAAPAVGAEGSLADTVDGHPEIVVHGRQIEQTGRAATASEGTVGYADFKDKPISRVGELAENVPGLIATQRSGTGKANQYFLRG